LDKERWERRKWRRGKNYWIEKGGELVRGVI
jgi:hypothetical protein